jgi:hypothetical protein
MHNLKDVAEYIDIDIDYVLLKDTLEICFNNYNSSKFSPTSTKMQGYNLEDWKTGKDTIFNDILESILVEHRKVHPDIKKRNTGFNVSHDADAHLFIHNDLDPYTDHPNHYNMIIPVHGLAKVIFYETRDEELYVPSRDIHNEIFHKKMKDETLKVKMGEIIIDKPVLLNTKFMHEVVILEAPRSSWVTRWINIPEEYDFQIIKDRIERILKS